MELQWSDKEKDYYYQRVGNVAISWCLATKQTHVSWKATGPLIKNGNGKLMLTLRAPSYLPEGASHFASLVDGHMFHQVRLPASICPPLASG